MATRKTTLTSSTASVTPVTDPTVVTLPALEDRQIRLFHAGHRTETSLKAEAEAFKAVAVRKVVSKASCKYFDAGVLCARMGWPADDNGLAKAFGFLDMSSTERGKEMHDRIRAIERLRSRRVTEAGLKVQEKRGGNKPKKPEAGDQPGSAGMAEAGKSGQKPAEVVESGPAKIAKPDSVAAWAAFLTNIGASVAIAAKGNKSAKDPAVAAAIKAIGDAVAAINEAVIPH